MFVTAGPRPENLLLNLSKSMWQQTSMKMLSGMSPNCKVIACSHTNVKEDEDYLIASFDSGWYCYHKNLSTLRT